MSTIPGNLSRVPTMLASSIQLGAINRTGVEIVELQNQLSSGERVERPSDDVIGTGALSVVEDRLEKRDQNLRNLEHARGTVDTSDAALADLASILLEAKSVASSQIGVGSDDETRESQAVVIDALLNEMVNIGNRSYQLIQLFGGSRTDTPPFESALGGIRYAGTDEELLTDLPVTRPIPLSLPGSEAFGTVSRRQEGRIDLDPAIGDDTRLLDLNGARGLGVETGAINADVDGVDIVIDLSEAYTVGDVVDRLQSDLAAIDPTITVGQDGRGITISSAGATVTISDQAAPATAADLGIAGTFAAPNASGGDLDARLTDLTNLDDLLGAPRPWGTIRLENGGQTRDVDLSTVDTVQELRNTIEGLEIGIRVQISDTADRLDFINEVSGARMSIGEVAGSSAASVLGLRTLDRDTPLSQFNDGRGVQIVSGNNDPVTGAPDPTRDVDFSIETKGGAMVDVDLAGAVTVGDVLDRINAAAGGLGLGVPTFVAGLSTEGNGITIVDATNAGTGMTRIIPRNQSFAAEDLGLQMEGDGATLIGEDRATVAVDGLFSRLINLRDALRDNDERGIVFAGEKLDADIARVAEVRAEVGVRSRRIASATEREEDLKVLDTSLRSEIRDLDFSEAAVRFNLLQQQLQAGLNSASRLIQLSLLDFVR